MNFIIGLGNPGEKYDKTRHNAGWMFIDYIIRSLSLENLTYQKKVYSELLKSNGMLLAKPQTFMNESGKAVQAILNWYGAGKEDSSKLVLVYDDLDIPLGKYKIQYGSGPKVHNGVNSIRESLRSDQFWNVRIGVDNRNGDRTLAGSEYVLQKFNNVELGQLKKVLPDIWAELTTKIQ